MRPNDPFLFDEEGYRKPAYYKALDVVAALPNGAKGPQLKGTDGRADAARNVFRCPIIQAAKAPNYPLLFLSGAIIVLSTTLAALRHLRPELWLRLSGRCGGGGGREAAEGLTHGGGAMEMSARTQPA
jgi:hypothetical protein